MAEPSGFDLLAASLRADATDLRAFVEALATKLELSFPERTQVARGGRLLGPKRVRKVTVDLGEGRYELEHSDGAVTTRRRTVVRGISLKSEELGLDEWIDDLSEQLVAEADKSERGRAALERLLEG
jgi:hypothetical protein